MRNVALITGITGQDGSYLWSDHDSSRCLLCGLSFVIMFWNNALKRFFIPVRIVYTEIRCDTSQKVEVRDGKKEISVF